VVHLSTVVLYLFQLCAADCLRENKKFLSACKWHPAIFDVKLRFDIGLNKFSSEKLNTDFFNCGQRAIFCKTWQVCRKGTASGMDYWCEVIRQLLNELSRYSTQMQECQTDMIWRATICWILDLQKSAGKVRQSGRWKSMAESREKHWVAC